MITLIVTLLLCEAIVLGSLVYNDHGVWGTFSLIVAIACYGVITGWQSLYNIWSGVINSPVKTGLIILGYILAGVIWSFFKYYSYVREKKRIGVKKEYVFAARNTGRVMTWMAYWPILAILHVCGDGLYKLYRWVYDQVSGVYDAILNKVYGE